MLVELKIAMLTKGIRQTQMAVELGWDPAKLSRIVHRTLEPTPQERRAIASYLDLPEAHLFAAHSRASKTNGAGDRQTKTGGKR